MYLDCIIIVSIMWVKFYLLMFKLIQSCVIHLKPVWFKCMHFWSVALPWCWRTTGHSHAAWPRRYNTAARDQQTPTDPTLSRLLPSMTNHLSGQNIIKLLLWVVWHLTMSTCRRQGTITAKLGATSHHTSPLRVLCMQYNRKWSGLQNKQTNKTLQVRFNVLIAILSFKN